MERMESFSRALRALPEYFSSVQPTTPPAYFFKVPPSSLPRTLSPPSDHPTLAHPFAIPYDTYNYLLQPQIPVTIALVYITLATYLNAVNEKRKFKPWAFSQTAFFKIMVITHNAILALYSFWTFIGMVNALRRSFYSPWDEYGLAGTIDSLCKINGPRGHGSAATYNETTTAWGITNRVFHLAADGLGPDPTDVGRIWNEGLAFYGWLFYLSKFYEVIDTFIILAKGKKSSFLQTYHHAGAMLCMWAGIRYMSPPIWMFVLVNSFIHTVMYTFYFCICLRIRVPVWFKRTLTTLQITQFVIGATYAFLHLFVKYKMPISVPYLYRLGTAASAAPSAASSVLSTAVATADGRALLKKLLLRAAGREGLAENVLNNRGETFDVGAVKAVREFAAREETRYRQESVWTHCIDTSGQAFAIWLNCLYLLPLTWLFARFFIKAYLHRDERRRNSSTSQKAYQSSKDAYKGVSRRLSEAFEELQQGVEGDGDDVAVIDGEELRKEVRKIASATEKQVKKVTSATEKELKKVTSPAKKGMSNALDELKEKTDPLKAKAKGEFQDDLKKAKSTLEKTKADSASSVNKAGNTAMNVLQETKDSAASTIKSAAHTVQDTAGSVTESISESAWQTVSSDKKKKHGSAEHTGSGENAKKDMKKEGSSNQRGASSSEGNKKTDQNPPQLSKKESSHRSTGSQEFESQQSSWIHVKDEAEEAVSSAAKTVQSKLESPKSSTNTGKPASNEAKPKSTHPPKLPPKGDKSAAAQGSGSKDQSKKPVQDTKPSSTNAKGHSENKGSDSSTKSTKPSANKDSSHTASHDHEHPSYAEVAAEAATHEDTADSESHLSASQHESATSHTATTGKHSDEAGSSGQQSQASSSDASALKKTASKSTSSKSTAHTSKTHESHTSTSQATNVLSAVKASAAVMEGDAKIEAEQLAAKIESDIEAGKETVDLKPKPDSSEDGTLWFEKLTTGIDSKESTKEKKEIDKIIDESEAVRDEVVDTAEGTSGDDSKKRNGA